jgi:hypothetical protein
MKKGVPPIEEETERPVSVTGTSLFKAATQDETFDAEFQNPEFEEEHPFAVGHANMIKKKANMTDAQRAAAWGQGIETNVEKPKKNLTAEESFTIRSTLAPVPSRTSDLGHRDLPKSGSGRKTIAHTIKSIFKASSS